MEYMGRWQSQVRAQGMGLDIGRDVCLGGVSRLCVFSVLPLDAAGSFVLAELQHEPPHEQPHLGGVR